MTDLDYNLKLKIIISKELKLKCVLANDETSEVIRFKDNRDEYKPSISINGNKMLFCEDEHKPIYFMEDWYSETNQYRRYPLNYLGKEYSVSIPVLFALIVNEFKKKVEKKNIISCVHSQFYLRKNQTVINGMYVAFKALGFKEIDLDDVEEEKPFMNDGEIIKEILERKDCFERYQRMISRAIVLVRTDEEKNKLVKCRENVVSDETFAIEMRKFSTTERTKLKLFRLNKQAMTEITKYLISINDHINFTKVGKKCGGNWEQFTYNPVSVDEKTFEFFPNATVLHCYAKKDKYFEHERITKYVDWVKRGWKESQEKIAPRTIEFRKIIFTKEDYLEGLNDWNIIIPNGVEEIASHAFGLNYIKQIEIPNTVTSIARNCFDPCECLTSISFPLNETRVLYGNKLFNNKPFFSQSIYLPNSITVINGQQVEQLKKITLPSFVTSLDEKCFFDCSYLSSIVFPEHLTSIGTDILLDLPQLFEITISPKFKLNGDRLLLIKNHCLHSIVLPSTVTKINNENIHWSELKKYSIPWKVSEISDNCFAHCQELTKLDHLKKMKTIGKGCLSETPKLELNPKKLSQELIWFAKYELRPEDKRQLEQWTNLKCSEVLFDSNTDDWSKETSVFNEKILGKKQVVVLVEDEDTNERFGYYLNVEIPKQYKYHRVDDHTFHFNLGSNKRLPKPMKFEMKNWKKGGFQLFNKQNEYFLITIGNIELRKKDCKHLSRCWQEEEVFNFKGIENAISGKIIYQDEKLRQVGECFTPKRILVIQMKEEEVEKKKK